ncbi:hypothetical protein B0H10DRAFT_1878291 [Mycena sp. CBHHK59/15]|nr:hypothetical protein B0H10DRAFT_1878291 [Mycena sp. CBHHK59/15]
MMAAATLPDQQGFHLPRSSPLDTLVRKTSRKGSSVAQQQRLDARAERRWPQQQPEPILTGPEITQRQPYQVHHPAAPSSPLLHSHFSRQSTATWGTNDNSSYLDLGRDSVNVIQELGYADYDISSPELANASSPALRDSWQSNSDDHHTIRPGIDTDVEEWAVPSVMVSAPEQNMGYATSRAGKTPIIRPTTANFSRPARSAVEVPDAWEDEQKRRVLERNASRRSGPNTPDAQAVPHSQYPLPPTQNNNLRPDSTPSIYSYASTSRGHSPEPGRNTQYSSQPVDGPSSPNALAPPGAVTLPRRPPSLRTGSPVSLYSTYSFYQLDSATPSPTDKQFAPKQQQPTPKHITFATTSPLPTPLASPSTPAGLRTAQDYLQLGITHHEADRLPESALCFEQAATLDGGTGVGMLMWGLALRHGWGCTKNEKHGFKWLRRAAEAAVDDLEAARAGGAIDAGAVQTELVLAIYEVGQCFFHGWGIPKDQKMGVSYYTVAARMGDADAQMDLAFCLANGKGAKKDRKEAAKWYRAAVKQGQSDIGLAWIYKEKYQ